MTGWIGRVMQAAATRSRQWRRRRNMRAGGVAPRRPLPSPGALLCGVAVVGAVVLAGHARHLGSAVAGTVGQDAGTPADATLDGLQAVAPGASFAVPGRRGASLTALESAALVVLNGMEGAEAARIDLCRGGARARLSPIRVGYRFDALPTAGSETMQHVVLAPPETPMPRLDISGQPRADFSALKVALDGRSVRARWISDTGGNNFRREGWVVWDSGAIRLQRRTTRQCSTLGELRMQYFSPGKKSHAAAQVTALAYGGTTATAWLPPGHYTVPTAARASLEDQALFQQLHEHGLVRLSQNGLAEIAPRDLALWQAAPATSRIGQLQGWPVLEGNKEASQLFKRLYRMADGAYIREQVRVFNNERRLLAWRVRPVLDGAGWQAAVGNAPATTTAGLPLAAARLFAALPEGWLPWQRIGAWPGAGDARGARLEMRLPAGHTGRVEVLLAGRLQQVEGGDLVTPARPACTGRACRSPDTVQHLVIQPAPGARTLALTAAPLEMAALADGGNQQYRHLRVSGGQLAWRRLNASSATARADDPAGVVLHDRHGTLLWSGGAPEAAAVKAGMAPLLGLRAGHANSVAGMLARVPAPNGLPHEARLTLDLALQQASHAALDCIGMRRGRWDGATCSAAQQVPEGRQAGLVIIDTESGDILAAAGAGGGTVSASNWDEVRDFDRVNPDRSPLRLPALQHDGGAHRSPGSTFKIVSALGLELAAQRDRQLEALLAGMQLASINDMARRKGFAFQTAAASYPVDTRQARITNFRDQHLDRRAHQGRLGLAQALTYSLNTWFAWTGELSDRSLFGRADGGIPGVQALAPAALDSVRPIVAMAHRVGFGRDLRLDGGLLPEDFRWQQWDALQPGEARIDPIHTRHELRQMAIGLRMQATPLHMAMVAGAVGEGRMLAPRLLLELDGREAEQETGAKLEVRLDRVRAGMKGVVDAGTAAGAFRAPALAQVRRGLSGKTGTSPSIVAGANGARRELATVWFTGWLEPGSIPGEQRRLAVAAFVSHSEGTGGDHAAPVVAAVLEAMQGMKRK